uniref:Uncharacterized protein n=1 Tax=Setaria viridis TaxID=4556 RepID=A0A4U6TQ13_SETVI|nr:hypothetical protein SEVIR_7G037900v2 [Setaria viridis]
MNRTAAGCGTGVILGTTSEAMIIMLVAALDAARRWSGSESIAGLPRLPIYAADPTHSTTFKACRHAGFDPANICSIPTGPETDYALDPAKLLEVMEDRASSSSSSSSSSLRALARATNRRCCGPTTAFGHRGSPVVAASQLARVAPAQRPRRPSAAAPHLASLFCDHAGHRPPPLPTSAARSASPPRPQLARARGLTPVGASCAASPRAAAKLHSRRKPPATSYASRPGRTSARAGGGGRCQERRLGGGTG